MQRRYLEGKCTLSGSFGACDNSVGLLAEVRMQRQSSGLVIRLMSTTSCESQILVVY